MQPRTIKLTNSDVDREFDPTDRKFQEAVGYLMLWAYGSERYVNLRVAYDREGHLDATYMNAAGEVTYNIGGIRDEKSGNYSFHS